MVSGTAAAPGFLMSVMKYTWELLGFLIEAKNTWNVNDILIKEVAKASQFFSELGA